MIHYNFCFYLDCWNGEPEKRPSIYKVVERLKNMITQQNENFVGINNTTLNENDIPNNNNTLIQTTTTSNPITNKKVSKPNLNIIIDKIVYLIFDELNKGIESKIRDQIFDYLNNQNLTLQEVIDWLMNHQNNSNVIFLFGYFNFFGIEINENHEEAFELFFEVSEQHTLAQYFTGKCYQEGYGVAKDERLAFEYYKRSANKNFAMGQFDLGSCYENGIGVEKNLGMAVDWYEKAIINGNIIAMYVLGLLYKDGKGVEKDDNKAFDLFKRTAKEGYPNGINMLGYFYENGIGISVDKQKAFELFKKAANLGNSIAQYRLGDYYHNGIDV